MSTGGKGSALRPSLISRKEFDDNWDTIFKNKETVKQIDKIMSSGYVDDIVELSTENFKKIIDEK